MNWVVALACFAGAVINWRYGIAIRRWQHKVFFGEVPDVQSRVLASTWYRIVAVRLLSVCFVIAGLVALIRW